MILASVFDCKAETWSRPFVADSKASAMRDFATLVANKDTLPGQHPEDFKLYCLYEFHGNADGYDFDAQHLANGVDYVSKEMV